MKAALRSGNGTRPTTRGMALLTALVTVLLGAASPAGAVAIDIADAIAGTVGDTLDVAVTTEDLTGLGVHSYEFDLTYTASRAALIGVVETGTLTAAWGPPAFGAGTGTVHVAAAGAAPLAGSGTLVLLRFVLGPTSGTCNLNFAGFLFNEGSPPATTSNGWISVTALPTITVSPDSGEILAGGTLSFTAFGGSAPYTFGVTDPSVASIDGTGLLTGLSEGVVRVWAEDAVAVRDTTNADILVRAMALTAPVVSEPAGASFTLPITVTDVTGLGIRGFEFDLDWFTGRFDVVSANFAGTVAAGWGAPEVSMHDGHASVAAAGDAPLSGAGVLVNLDCVVQPLATGFTTLTLSAGLFDERYVPLHVGGSFTTNVPGTIFVTPNTSQVLVGDTIAFSVLGATTPPFTWGTTDSSIGTIDGAGLFTPVSGGDVLVTVEDAAGARDTTGVIAVYDLRVSIPNQTVQTAFASTPIRVEVDRDVTALGIYGLEYTVHFDDADLVAIAATDSGSISAAWGPPITHVWPDSIRVSHAGSTPLTGGPGVLTHLYFEPAPGAPNGAASYANFTLLTMNEGSPRPLVSNGTLTVDDTITGVPPSQGRLGLAQNRPNPFKTETTIQYALRGEAPADLRLVILDPAGRVVRRLGLGDRAAGVHHVRWDGKDGRGRRVANGVYFYRLSGGGERTVRKAVVLR